MNQRALALAEQVGNPADIATSLNDIGMIYHSQGQLETALNYFSAPSSSLSRWAIPLRLLYSFNNIGDIYRQQGKLSTGRWTITSAPWPSLSRWVSPASIALSLNNIGGIYDSQGRLDKAMAYYQRGLAPF